MNKKTLFLIMLLIVLAIPALTSAAATDLKTIVKTFADSLTKLATYLSTIAFIVAGVMFLSASGNPSRMTIAKGSLIAGVIGIVIVILASGACGFVATLFGLQCSAS
jgi:hypothetical protein